MKNLLVVLMMIFTHFLQAQEITGQWNGMLDIQGTELRVVFHVAEENDGFVSLMDSPDQGAEGIETTSTSFEDDKITIIADAMGMKYEGMLAEDQSSIEGTFEQGPMSIPLTLSRKKAEKEVVPRKQDPTDFPYEQEEVKFKNKKGGHSLAGTLTYPSSGKFEKVVVLITGSGPQNRNEEVVQFNHRPFLVLSDYLTRNGIAVLRYDDRGVGESEGEYKGANSFDFAADVDAAVAFIKSRKDMKGKEIGLVGHSEGGMIAPIVASENTDVDFITLLAGPGTEISELLVKQAELIGRAEGAPEDILVANAKITRKAYDYLKTNVNLDKEKMKAGLTTIFEENLHLFPAEVVAEIEANKDEFIAGQIEELTHDWFLSFIRFNPQDYLSKVSCPVLAINGALDLQVPSVENLKSIKVSLEKAGNKNVTIKEFEGQNHIFQTATSGAPSEYATIEETFNENTMKFIANWINQLN